MDKAWHEELVVNGFVVVFTDGACSSNQDPRLRRAGFGAFWSVNHPCNVSAAVDGDIQTNQNAELHA
eukprot:8280832-Karenia_brevis.AAC.1